MPSVKCYLSNDMIEDIKAIARFWNIPVSKILRDAIEDYVKITKQRQARERVLKILSEKMPLGNHADWEIIHFERTCNRST